MDKRSFLAIAATFIILLVWQFLYIAPKQKESARIRALEMRDKEVADSLALLESGGRENVLSAEDETSPAGRVAGKEESIPGEDLAGDEDLFSSEGSGTRKRFTVTTGKMIVELTNLGGEITSIELTEFERNGGGPVELVPEGAPGALSFSVEKNGRRTGFSGAVFDVTVNGRELLDGENIDLTGEMEKARIVFRKIGPGGGGVEKRLVFSEDGYEVGVAISLFREGGLREVSGYALSWESGIALNEKDRKWELRQMASLGKVGEEYYKEGTGKFGKTNKKEHDGMVVWAGARSKYFLTALIVDEQRTSVLEMLGDRETNMAGYSIYFPLRGDPGRVDASFRCYFGPLDMHRLKDYGNGLERTIELGKLRFFSVFVLRLIMWMNGFIPNYGLIIIILSILTKVLFYRLTHKSFKSMKDMQRLQPKLKEMQEKYKDDKEKLNKETMKMYKEAGVNPLGGCLPLLFQMPVFIALFNVLRNTIELRDAPLGLWINDLSSPDVLFGFGFSLPVIGSEFHLLPILMGVAMVVQSKMGGSPTGDAGPAAQTKMMTTMMPVIFTFIFYGMPSGLVLYWLINNILSIVQQYYVHKSIEAESVEGAETA
ncbi:MAG: membrane protein insertase YidC [Candidatus Krumholzibacteriota bacterium]|nr:membrane protein insertase YidC [Candidatus Krumholzibacteriota bacterium]